MSYKNSLTILFAILLSGCSYYSLKGSLPADVNSIYISPIVNKTSESGIHDQINISFSDLFIKENILNIEDLGFADSKLDIVINSISDKPNIFTVTDNEIEQLEEYKLTVNVKIEWIDLNKDEIILSKSINEWVTYSALGIDIGQDNIDNDLDGLIDSEDSDEYGQTREGIIRIISDKISKRILNELTSTW